MAASASEAKGAFINANPTGAGEERGVWPMDETSGTTVHDVSGLGNDGTLNGNATWGPGKVGGALVLDGTGDYASVPDDASLDITGPITMAAWVKPGRFATQDLIAKEISGVTGSGYQLSLATDEVRRSDLAEGLRAVQQRRDHTCRLHR